MTPQVRGRTVNGATLEPVRDALVIVSHPRRRGVSASARSNREGEFRVPHARGDRMSGGGASMNIGNVEITAPGFVPYRTEAWTRRETGIRKFDLGTVRLTPKR